MKILNDFVSTRPVYSSTLAQPDLNSPSNTFRHLQTKFSYCAILTRFFVYINDVWSPSKVTALWARSSANPMTLITSSRLLSNCMAIRHSMICNCMCGFVTPEPITDFTTNYMDYCIVLPSDDQILDSKLGLVVTFKWRLLLMLNSWVADSSNRWSTSEQASIKSIYLGVLMVVASCNFVMHNCANVTGCWTMSASNTCLS